MPEEGWKDFLKMRAEWKRAIKSLPLPRGRYPAGVSRDEWLGVLDGSLSYHGSATVSLYTFDSGLGYFTDSGSNDTCYGWLLFSGNSIPANTQVVGGWVNGKRVVFNAACSTGT